MTKDEEKELEQVVHDSWSLLNLAIAGTRDALMDVDLIEGEPNTPSASYRIDDTDLSTIWGALEAMNHVRDLLWGQLQRI